MSQPSVTTFPAPIVRRAFDRWLAQVKHTLPPTIFSEKTASGSPKPPSCACD